MNISQMLSKNAELYPDDIALIELAPGQKTRKVIGWRGYPAQI